MSKLRGLQKVVDATTPTLDPEYQFQSKSDRHMYKLSLAIAAP